MFIKGAETTAEHYLAPFQLEQVHWATRICFAALHVSTNDYKVTANTDLGVTSKFKGVGELAKTQAANNEAQLYLPRPLTNVSIQLKGNL